MKTPRPTHPHGALFRRALVPRSAVLAVWLILGGVAALGCGSATLAPPVSTAVPPTAGPAAPSATPVTAAGTAVPGAAPAVAPGTLPRADLTPGAADPRVTQGNIGSTICLAGYTASVRPPVSYTEPLKARLLAAYGIGGPLANYELDHLIPLELGGAPRDARNLWPEPWESRGARLAPPGQGAESKDRVETALREDVCGGRMSLSDAQRRIATDWMTAEP